MTPLSYERFWSIHPSPAEWMPQMTVCVVAKFKEGIIGMSDRMMSTGAFSADNVAFKFRDLHMDWKCMFAGNDVTRIIPIVEKVSKILSTGPGKCSLEQCSLTLSSVFKEQLVEKQTDLILARYGLDMQSFLQNGLSYFGPQIFPTIKYQLDQIELDCVFIAYGMDAEGEAHIFTVEDPGIIHNHDLCGFWAIGSGANRALSSLFFQEYSEALPEWEALYYVAEAKFMAESAGGVGGSTLVNIRRKNGQNVGSIGFNLVKKLWKKRGCPRIPKGTEEAMEKSLRSEFFDLSS